MAPATGSFERSDLYQIYNIVQNSAISFPKDIIISILRDEFAKDSYYHYVADEYGFPKVTAHKDLLLDAGFQDDQTTRIFIGEYYRFDAIMYPAILVKVSSVKSTPISLNRNKYNIEYEKTIIYDGYGNSRQVFTPAYIDLAGVYEGTLTLDIIDRDMLSRDNLASLLMIIFTDIKFETLAKAGVVVKPPSLTGFTEAKDRENVPLYKASISLEYRTEWRRLIPISSVVDQINFCIDFKNMETGITAPNLEISTNVLLDDVL
jgi:hypothetical protein